MVPFKCSAKPLKPFDGRAMPILHPLTSRHIRLRPGLDPTAVRCYKKFLLDLFSIIFIQKQYFLQVNSLLMPLKHTCTFCSLASLFKYLLRLVLALFIFHNICTRWKIYFSLNVRFQFQIHAPMKCLAQNKNYMQLNRSESLKALDFSEQCNSHHHHHVAPLTPFAKLLSKL